MILNHRTVKSNSKMTKYLFSIENRNKLSVVIYSIFLLLSFKGVSQNEIISKDYILKHNISSVIEWRINFDSVGKTIDSNIIEISVFNQFGLISREIIPNGTNYDTIYYIYNQEVLVSKKSSAIFLEGQCVRHNSIDYTECRKFINDLLVEVVIVYPNNELDERKCKYYYNSNKELCIKELYYLDKLATKERFTYSY